MYGDAKTRILKMNIFTTQQPISWVKTNTETIQNLLQVTKEPTLLSILTVKLSFLTPPSGISKG